MLDFENVRKTCANGQENLIYPQNVPQYVTKNFTFQMILAFKIIKTRMFSTRERPQKKNLKGLKTPNLGKSDDISIGLQTPPPRGPKSVSGKTSMRER